MAKIGAYIQESVDELVNKVSWPTWSELQSSSIVVLIASVIFALVIFVFDYVLGVNTGSEGQEPLFKGLLGYIYALFN